MDGDRDGDTAALVSGFSIEVTPRDIGRVAPLSRVLVPGTRVYVTALPGVSWEETVSTTKVVTAEGMRPVPHLAVRSVADRETLRRMIGSVAEAGAAELLLVAGSFDRPTGAYGDTVEVLISGLLEEAGIRRVGVAGHPEGNRDIGEPGLARALRAKNAVAAERGLDLYLVTQFCFAAAPVVAWERRIREAGNRLPVVVGLPGVTSPARLLRFGLACGVGASLTVLRKQAGGVLKLATAGEHRPSATLDGLAAARRADPGSLLRGVHFFPFGAVERTAAWAQLGER